MDKRVAVVATSVWMLSCAGSDEGSVGSQSAAVELPPSPSFSVSAAFKEAVPPSAAPTYCGGAGQDPCTSAPAVQVRWGVPASGGQKSGLGFAGSAPPSIEFGTPFLLGTLTHFNFPINGGSAASSVKLDLDVTVTPQGGGAPLFAKAVSISFTIDETANDAAACPGEATPCPDRIQLTGNAPQSDTVVVDNVVYTFTLQGFLDETGALATEFVSQEGGSRSAQLYATFTQRCTDDDEDGVCNLDDNCSTAANADQVDADHDGRGDACDACPHDAANDADADGVCGDVDNCPLAANPDQANSDGDGKGDACDACPHDAGNDADADGVCGDVDNCPTVANPSQGDLDGDGKGDACDACPQDASNDADHDGVCQNLDDCPAVPNPDQADRDHDGRGDACDACPLDPVNDADADGVCGNVDNCPLAANSDQADSDHDGRGDACDACPLDPANDADHDGLCGNVDTCPLDPGNDPDHDGVCGSVDQCPGTSSGPVDGHGCAIAQLCPCDNDWRNHGAYVSCVAHEANRFLAEGRISAAQRGQIQSQAAQSSCGR
jgi:Thrombospondin type 3 repeat